jgi:hypothetical protein
MHSFDSLLESDPEIQQIKVEVQQKVFMVVVKTRFPSLVEQAQQKVVRLHKEDDLYRLTELMAGCSRRENSPLGSRYLCSLVHALLVLQKSRIPSKHLKKGKMTRRSACSFRLLALSLIPKRLT